MSRGPLASSRREFLEWSMTVAGLVAAGAAPGARVLETEPGPAGGADPHGLLRHRFGVNYVPSRRWYYCYNDWNVADIARDLDRVAEVGADHLRVMVVWPWFQPNPSSVSAAHLDRLDELMRAAAERRLDVMPCIYTGWLSGWRFRPPFYEDEPFFTSKRWAGAQSVYLRALSARMRRHANFLGFDIGNEINCLWRTDAVGEGDAWMRRVFREMHSECPGCIHVNGVDNQPWFGVNTFSAEALVAEQEFVALHCWPFWTGAKAHGGPLDRPYTALAAGMAALARSLGSAPGKPMWLQEFGACAEEMPERDIPRWLELTVGQAIEHGISWFTWWASHDVSRDFEFHPFEYGLGLMTADNRLKEQGRRFRDLAQHYRGRPVVVPAEVPPPPQVRTPEGTWNWLLEWMRQEPRSSRLL